eukprot:2923428-Pyramimonas_sp.AAC.1
MKGGRHVRVVAIPPGRSKTTTSRRARSGVSSPQNADIMTNGLSRRASRELPRMPPATSCRELVSKMGVWGRRGR